MKSACVGVYQLLRLTFIFTRG